MKLPTNEEMVEAAMQFSTRAVEQHGFIAGLSWFRDLLQPQIEELEKRIKELEDEKIAHNDFSTVAERWFNSNIKP